MTGKTEIYSRQQLDLWLTSYGEKVSNEEHEKAIIKSQAFFGDMVDFLSTHQDEVVRTLQPDEKQRDALTTLFRTCKDTPIPIERIPMVDYLGRAVLVNVFEDINRSRPEENPML